MTNSIDYSGWKGLKAICAKLCDTNKNGKLEKNAQFDEISIFNQQYEKMVELENEIKNNITITQQDAIKDYRPKLVDPISPKADIEKTPSREEVTADMVKEEAKNRGVNIEDVDVDYWAKTIVSAAEKYNIPEAFLVSVIGQETNGKFTKNINSSTGAGPMQITTITAQDFFPEAKGNWNKTYKKMNEKLLNDILYQKDKNENFLTDRKGDYILKATTPKVLRDSCAKNDELGIQVGILCFEMKYVKAVAKYKFGESSFSNIPKTIEGLKDGSITLSAEENEKIIEEALKNYNSVFDSYAPAVIDSLKQHGLDFENLYFIRE